MKPLQIGVLGSAIDKNFPFGDGAKVAARRIGELIAQSGHVLVFGAEKDNDSIPTIAACGAKSAGGITVGITYDCGQNIWGNNPPTIIIPTGLNRGGGREFINVIACDAVIALTGGNGTLIEMGIAYHKSTPLVALAGFGGWADEMAGKYFDHRKRTMCHAVKTPEEAVELAVKLANEKRKSEKLWTRKH
jgi:uncharacterized protein (TIGR00725 family)